MSRPTVTINISYNTSYNTNLHFADDIVEDESLVEADCHHKHVVERREGDAGGGGSVGIAEHVEEATRVRVPQTHQPTVVRGPQQRLLESNLLHSLKFKQETKCFIFFFLF